VKLGLKLWSINEDSYLQEAKKLYDGGWFDYIELYIVPDSTNTLENWKRLKDENGIPFTLHAPHFAHGVNLADVNKEKPNLKIFKQVEEFFNALAAEYVVIHSGMEGNIDETIKQLKNITSQGSISTSQLLIENKPFIAPLDTSILCRGAVIEEIKKVIDEVGCGFCLDVGHAICTANTLKTEQYGLVAEFNKLNPACYHLSDNFIDNEIDAHKHFGDGDYDFKKILEIIDTSKNMAIETNKNSKENLDDFIGDVGFLRGIQIG